MAAESSRQQDLEERLRRLNEIGVALSGQDDLHTLLDRILFEARRFTGADAGTLVGLKGSSQQWLAGLSVYDH